MALDIFTDRLIIDRLVSLLTFTLGLTYMTQLTHHAHAHRCRSITLCIESAALRN